HRIGPFHFQDGQRPVHTTLCPNALYDLLTHVAALVEGHGVHLPGLLGQPCFENVFSVARLAVLDADGADVVHGGGLSAGPLEGGDQRIAPAHRSVHTKSRLSGTTDAGHGRVVPGQVRTISRGDGTAARG